MCSVGTGSVMFTHWTTPSPDQAFVTTQGTSILPVIKYQISRLDTLKMRTQGPDARSYSQDVKSSQEGCGLLAASLRDV